MGEPNHWNTVCTILCLNDVYEKSHSYLPDLRFTLAIQRKNKSHPHQDQPKKHTMSGLFQQQEVQLAVEQFNASPIQQPS